MEDVFYYIFAGILFIVGVRLSAFFSGAETGFYRTSHVRLTIDANAGDRAAERILRFAEKPSYFVATALVGNNVANYVTTLAIGIAAVQFADKSSGWAEIVGTLMVTPFVFIFGELMPKSLYYRAPLRLLRRDSGLFTLFFRLFLPVSFPLIWITMLLERFGNSNRSTIETVLGRKRLEQVLSQGRQQGILTEVQDRMIHGLLGTASQPVTTAMTPANRVLGVDESRSADEVIDYARQYGVHSVLVKRRDSETDWCGYVRVCDLVLSQRLPSLAFHELPQLQQSMTKRDALILLRQKRAAFGAIVADGQVIGTVSERGLIEQLVRATPPIAGG